MSKRPFTAIPAARSSARSLRIKQWLIIGAWIVLASLGPLSFVMTVRHGGAAAPVAVPAQIPTADVAFAQVVAEDFLAGRGTVMPVTEDLDASLGFGSGAATAFPYRNLVFNSFYEGTVPHERGLQRITIVTFRVQHRDGALYDLSVTLAKDGRGRPVLSALPYLRRSVLAATDSLPAVNYASAAGSITASNQIRTAIEQWARAYVADDREQLKVLINGATGGDAPAGDYIGLGSYTLAATPEVLSVVPHTTLADHAYARIRFVFSGGADGFTATNELDVLVSRFASNDPRVVAWGAPGTGPVLQPFLNNTAFQ